ncbi:uncharacterized protein LOC134234339 [Saccostrea cucullata]|uniref:uncharacterized protein LOC134234339 n=1 Tax=Saccostrea cuccullata TaxID=36930 RepID=UPI002ECFF602
MKESLTCPTSFKNLGWGSLFFSKRVTFSIEVLIPIFDLFYIKLAVTYNKLISPFLFFYNRLQYSQRSRLLLMRLTHLLPLLRLDSVRYRLRSPLELPWVKTSLPDVPPWLMSHIPPQPPLADPPQPLMTDLPHMLRFLSTLLLTSLELQLTG